MKTLCIVPCGKRKIWDKEPNVEPTRARDVYIGPFAKKCREYAENFYPSSWCILSAKHGFLTPDDLVPGPYDATFNNKSSNPISTHKLITQAQEKGLFQYDEIVVLGGKNYTQTVKKIFNNSKIITPLANSKGLGDMMGKLNEAIWSGVPL
jgi:hypothetical protein